MSADCTGTSPQTITFNANDAEENVTACTIVDDRLVEPDEIFKVKIEGVGSSNVRANLSERNVTIISNDGV